MKKYPVYLICFSISLFSAQKIKTETIFKDNISIRALQIDEGKVWYSGTDSKFGYVNLKDSADRKQMKLSDEKLEFRTLAQNNEAFYAINIQSPAKFFKIEKKTMKSEVVHVDSTTTAFYDALHYSNKVFYAFSDPEKTLEFQKTTFMDDGENFNFHSVTDDSFLLKEGEAAFAASNTNIASSKNWLWLATGGKASRIFRLNLLKRDWEVFETPFIQGTSSQGMYSIDFLNKNFGIAVGGDYTKQVANINNIATTNDGGRTWQIQASEKNGGYKTCVKFRPKSKGKDIIAVGDQNIEFSSDYGKTWKIISEEKGLYVCEWIDKDTLVFAGKNRIVKMKIQF